MHTSSHASKFFNRVLLVTAFLTTLFTTVHATDINLALGKHATQSSTYQYTTIAGNAVDGNTNGKILNNSTTHTKYEQGAWWQVDLSGARNINQIIIYNRTDCCADRLSNYRVSISNKADFSTHTYQQDFHATPNPKKTIKLDAPGKQGRYVRIQLLDKNYLSLAEVQVMGVDLLRFAKVDYSSAQNDFGGFYNAPNHPNSVAFATIKDDGSITAWGESDFGGLNAPAGSGYTKIYSNFRAFAALKHDGSIKAWGDPDFGGSDVPADSGYTEIYSNDNAFAALTHDGSIKAWGESSWGGTGALGVPIDKGYTEIYSTAGAFAVLTHDGSIKAWGESDFGGKNAPDGNGYTKIYSTQYAFAALKADGSIKAWGSSYSGGTNAPTDKGYTKIYSAKSVFAALKADGSITAWGDSDRGGVDAPSDNGYIKIYPSRYAFAAMKADGSIKVWGDPYFGGANAPFGSGYTKIYSNENAFAALTHDGSIKAWGHPYFGGEDAPAGSGYTKIYSTNGAFAVLKADGSITAWGAPESGGSDAPTDSGYIKIYSTSDAFAAIKANGSITAWGRPDHGGSHASGYNLALGKHATQSSTYQYTTVAGNAVDGNTNGKILNNSTTHTKYEQGAWWQVDLGEEKNINQIIIYNRTDCCKERLSNYRVSISNKASFSTHTYQQDFHVAPHPKTNIKLDAPGKQGRYVRIQLLDKNYLSLAEVQVMGVDL